MTDTKEYNRLSVEKHLEYKGKLGVHSKVPLETREDLSIYYTPGVAQPCREIAQDPEKAYDYTRKGNTVAVVSDGSAVLGLGNIGGLAGLPVMEGKAILFKEFGGVDAIPLVLNTQDPDEIIRIVEAISPTFGGINLEDISAPNCFYIEEELKKRLSIPVFHDDQHGTAIVVLAGLINALKLAQKDFATIKVVMSGAGAAGTAIAKLLYTYGTKNIVMTDSQGALYLGREKMNAHKNELAEYNINNEKGTLKDIIKNADVFIGVSQPNLLLAEDIKTMADKPIVFAMANPNPEVIPEEAEKGKVFIYATGRSDYPNQINNLLVFPGIFKGALKYRKTAITTAHKIAAAEVLAACVEHVDIHNIIPSPLDKSIADKIAESIRDI
ncbi:MAG TPA: NADP-dependent malic enzyme [Candidatus Absconditabacterales bacterium]|nr:NADP-dependent malic enzyme [Candidatus Absconditabacterales bacterium]